MDSTDCSNKSGYQRALEAAGANVLDFAEFGSYQGDWFALINYKGKLGFIHDTYGSCAGCDVFQSDMGWRAETPEKLRAFGEQYLSPENILNYDKALESASKHLKWDVNAKEMVEWVKSHKHQFLKS